MKNKSIIKNSLKTAIILALSAPVAQAADFYFGENNEILLAINSDKDFDLLKPDNFHELITPFSSMLPQVNAMFEY